jgi:hypothetical protein
MFSGETLVVTAGSSRLPIAPLVDYNHANIKRVAEHLIDHLHSRQSARSITFSNEQSAATNRHPFAMAGLFEARLDVHPEGGEPRPFPSMRFDQFRNSAARSAK